ncbi:hypothetical protein [Bradyrhizobium sp. JR3.5]
MARSRDGGISAASGISVDEETTTVFEHRGAVQKVGFLTRLVAIATFNLQAVEVSTTSDLNL